MRWNHDERFPAVNIQGNNCISTLPERFLLMDGSNVYHPNLLEDALRHQGVCVFTDVEQRPIGLEICTQANLRGNFSENPDEFIAAPAGSYALNVHKPENRKTAERLVLKSLIKNTDGWFSIHLNRPISLAISFTRST